MSNKIQELTDKLYNEGLSKGREEGEKLLRDAKSEAGTIIAKAREEAAAIIEKAGKDAEALKSKAESDIRMASAQSLQATKKDIENLIVAKLAETGALKDTEFLKEIIRTVAEKFSEESSDLNLILPESLRSGLESWVSGSLAGELGSGISAEFSKKISGGFRISPKDGSYFISFTDETFRELISEYLRPLTRKILFGE